MSESITVYLISVVCAAVVTAIATNFIGQNGPIASVSKFVCRLFLIITVISPLLKFRFEDLADYFSNIDAATDHIVAQGEDMAQEEIIAIITERFEAYILDKASTMDLDICVDISISETPPYIPLSATVTGNVSPYGKQRLEQILLNDLGIAKEDLIWA